MKPSLLLGLFLLCCAACSKSGDAPTSYGDPIGIRVSSASDAGGGVDLDVAVAASKGKDLSGAVNKLAVALHGASKACPDLASLGTDKTLQVRIGVVAGKLKGPDNKPENKLAACVVDALSGKEVLPATESLELLAEFRLHAAKGT